jgi:Uma2 family endonuclease
MSALPYRVNPDDPRAPSQEIWDRLTAEEREAILASLPSEFPVSEEAAPEGDPHYEAKSRARETLKGYFSRIGRKVYVACELPVYYPDEPMFAPDVMAVVGVEMHPRMHWTVSHEKKGLDLALEVHVSGNRRKDLQRNVERYARLGIHEYWVFDRKRLRLSGWRLSEGRQYRQSIPQHGFYQSEVLGLELQVENERLRFYHGRAPLPEADELIDTLEQMVEQVEARSAELEQQLAEEQRLRAEEQRLRAEEQRLRTEEQQHREEAERRLAEALAELERLRGGRS